MKWRPSRMNKGNSVTLSVIWASLVAQMVKRLPAIRETRVQSPGREDPLEKEMATHSSTLAWKIPWVEEPGRLQSMGLQRVGHDWATSLSVIYLFGCAGSSLLCAGFSLRWLLLLQSMSSEVRLTGLMVPQHVGSSLRGIEPLPPALSGGFSATAPPGKLFLFPPKGPVSVLG